MTTKSVTLTKYWINEIGYSNKVLDLIAHMASVNC